MIRFKSKNSDSNRSQRGATMAEFAVVSGVFFMIVFGIIEFGRLLYTHNALTDASRRGARYAALHKEADKPGTADHDRTPPALSGRVRLHARLCPALSRLVSPYGQAPPTALYKATKAVTADVRPTANSLSALNSVRCASSTCRKSVSPAS